MQPDEKKAQSILDKESQAKRKLDCSAVMPYRDYIDDPPEPTGLINLHAKYGMRTKTKPSATNQTQNKYYLALTQHKQRETMTESQKEPVVTKPTFKVSKLNLDAKVLAAARMEPFDSPEKTESGNVT